ncbi:MAG: NUDIX hydrolase [Clostridium sp.]
MNWIDKIKTYIPYNEQEEADKAIFLEAIENYDNLLTRENRVMHFTSSGYIVNKNRDKVLMIYHKIYNAWSWTGGHNDGDADMLHVAIKEAQEETGLKNFTPVSQDIFSLDILPVKGHFKKGSFISPHLHLSLAFLLEADETEKLIVNEEETCGVKWIPINEIAMQCNEPEMVKLYEKFNKKIHSL